MLTHLGSRSYKSDIRYLLFPEILERRRPQKGESFYGPTERDVLLSSTEDVPFSVGCIFMEINLLAGFLLLLLVMPYSKSGSGGLPQASL